MEKQIRKFTIVGTIRNSARNLRSEVARYQGIFSQLGEVNFFLVESDSKDKTTDVLLELAKKYTNFRFVSLGNLENRYPSRVERITHCRNAYVSEIRKSPTLRSADFTIVADLDNKSRLLTARNIEVSLNRNIQWSALFANQKHKYYDIYALRHPIWCPNDIREEIAWYKKYFPNYSAKDLATFKKMIKIPTDSDPIPVDSAFGGLGIYRTESFLKFDYTPTNSNSHEISEHVVLNRKIVEGGGKIYIDPQLLNFGWIHHSLETYRWWRMVNLLKKKLSNNLDFRSR